MVRGEIPIESGASWISPKCVEAQRFMFFLRGKALLRMRAGNSVPNRCKLRILSVQFISETVGDKLHCQEGNSPEHQLRPLNNY